MTTSPDYRRLARAVAVRRSKLRQTQQQLAEAAGVSDRTVLKVEGGDGSGFRRTTLYALEDALGWEAGSVDRILDGGDPTIAEQPEYVTEVLPVRPDIYAFVAALGPLNDIERQQVLRSAMAEAERMARRGQRGTVNGE